jgi:hypothetical protein
LGAFDRDNGVQHDTFKTPFSRMVTIKMPRRSRIGTAGALHHVMGKEVRFYETMPIENTFWSD